MYSSFYTHIFFINREPDKSMVKIGDFTEIVAGIITKDCQVIDTLKESSTKCCKVYILVTGDCELPQ